MTAISFVMNVIIFYGGGVINSRSKYWFAIFITLVCAALPVITSILLAFIMYGGVETTTSNTNKVSNFGKSSWQFISNASDYIATYSLTDADVFRYYGWQVGDEITIKLNGGELVTLVILGFNHDYLSNGSGKAGITMGCKQLLSYGCRYDSVDNSWLNSDVRNGALDDVYCQMPVELQKVIRTVDKYTSVGNMSREVSVTQDKLFLFSRIEIDGTATGTYCDEGRQYRYWSFVRDGKNATDRIKYHSNGLGEVWPWWLRSVSTGSTQNVHWVGKTGGIGNPVPYTSAGICFGFCV